MTEKRFNPCNPLKYVNCDKCQMWQFMRCIHYGYGTITRTTEKVIDKEVFK